MIVSTYERANGGMPVSSDVEFEQQSDKRNTNALWLANSSVDNVHDTAKKLQESMGRVAHGMVCAHLVVVVPCLDKAAGGLRLDLPSAVLTRSQASCQRNNVSALQLAMLRSRRMSCVAQQTPVAM